MNQRVYAGRGQAKPNFEDLYRTAQERVQQLERRVEELVLDKDELLRQIHQLTADHADAVEYYRNELDSCREQCKDCRDEVKQAREDARVEVQNANAAHNDLQERLTTALQDAQDENAMMRLKLDSLSAFMAEKEMVEGRILELEAKLEEVQENKSYLQNQLPSEIENLKSESTELLTNTIKFVHERQENLSREPTYRKLNRTLEEQNSTLYSRCQQFQEINDALQAKCHNLQIKLEIRKDVQKLAKQQLRKEVEKEKSPTLDVESQTIETFTDLERTVEQYKQSIFELNHENFDLRTKLDTLATLNSQFDQWRQKAQTLRALTDELLLQQASNDDGLAKQWLFQLLQVTKQLSTLDAQTTNNFQ